MVDISAFLSGGTDLAHSDAASNKEFLHVMLSAFSSSNYLDELALVHGSLSFG